MKYLFFIILLSVAAVSCSTYHAGVSLPANQRVLYVEQVTNLTNEAALTSLFKSALTQRIENTTGIRGTRHRDKAALAIIVKIEEMEQSSAASGQLRNHEDRNDSSDTYQTVMFRLTAKWSYQVVTVKDGKELFSGELTSTADVHRLPDLEMSRRAALREVTRSAAEKLIWAITEQ